MYNFCWEQMLEGNALEKLRVHKASIKYGAQEFSTQRTMNIPWGHKSDLDIDESNFSRNKN